MVHGQAILIPALLHAAYGTCSRNLIWALAIASAVIEIEALGGLKLGHSVFFLWTAPAWFLWYLAATRPRYASRKTGRSPADEDGKTSHTALEVDSARLS